MLEKAAVAAARLDVVETEEDIQADAVRVKNADEKSMNQMKHNDTERPITDPTK
jgi:hypothetical protein